MPLSIDHIVIAVADLEAAVRDYAALGFTVLPGGEHPRGSRNALVVFEDGAYLEIIAFPRPVPDFRWWQVLDRAGPGLVDYAVLPDDFEADLARARAAGIVMDGPIEGGRLQPDGARLAWRSARPPEPDIPFLVTDVTPRDLRVPAGAARRHPNGVTGVAGVTVAVQDLVSSTARYRALLGREPVARGGVPGLGFGLVQFRIGRQTLSLVEPREPAAAASSAHLVARGQGAYAISFYGPEDAPLDIGLTHGAPLEIVREL
ncbi:glyoxalase [Bosea thiooxidans]|uniref:Glyoxalase n=1 Tax=Bosea thiooxidans TaxID=53254 RepID=A0A0Q3I3B2_9HYPH|nr:VOC family protein [Bosea thiooxidans]KQK29439.1 glyoxalase [Bosea thiooxidans]SKB84234.1 Glyoxalase-like domain-containing protein [Bosea thiooxidans]